MVEENFKSMKDDMTKVEEKIDKNTKMVEENLSVTSVTYIRQLQ